MVLAIDIGNTNVVIGGFQEQQILFVERVSTNQNATSLELAISIKTILEIYQIQTTEIEGCIISSVVPSINHAVRKAVEKIAHCPVVLVGPGVKTGYRSPLTIRHSWAATASPMPWRHFTNTSRPLSSSTWALPQRFPSSMPSGGTSAA